MFLIVMVTTTLSIISPEKTVYVAGDGRGDFNRNGTDDQIEINKALAHVIFIQTLFLQTRKKMITT
ncbi:MAG: hypothetical protein QG610_2054 [Euryarchaeota archaeon]|nr:hypothetical protein [Euryarchaeota archaeon]